MVMLKKFFDMLFLSQQNVISYLRTAKKNLIRSELLNKREWNQINRVPFVFSLNNRFKTIAGQLSYKDKEDAFSLSHMKYIGGQLCQPHIEISPTYISWVNHKEVYDTISHEYAHLIHDILTNDIDDDTASNYHNPLWRAIHKFMGGTGNQYKENYIPNAKRKNICNRILKKFGEPMIITKENI